MRVVELSLLVFGLIGGVLGSIDVRRIRAGGTTGARRIALHLTMMLSATIAALTAFLVNVATFGPSLVVWLLPTAVITPVIVMWNRRVQSGRTVGNS